MTSKAAEISPKTVNYVFMNAESGKIVRSVAGAEESADEVRAGADGFMQAKFGDEWLPSSVANITYFVRQKKMKPTPEPAAPLQRVRGKKAADKAAATAKTKAKPKAKGKAKGKPKPKPNPKARPSMGDGGASRSSGADVEAAAVPDGQAQPEDPDLGVLDASVPTVYKYMYYKEGAIGLTKFNVYMKDAKKKRVRKQYISYRDPEKSATEEQLRQSGDLTISALEAGTITEDEAKQFGLDKLAEIG